MKPVDVYRQIIDQLVERSPSLGARLVTEEAIYSKAPAFRHTNDLVRTLTPEQRAILAEMLTLERESAIHDVLAALTWWIDCHDVGLTYQGKPHASPVERDGAARGLRRSTRRLGMAEGCGDSITIPFSG